MKEQITAASVHGFDKATGIGIELTYNFRNNQFQLRGHAIAGNDAKAQVDYAEKALPKYLNELIGALVQQRVPVTSITPIKRAEYVGKGRIIDGKIELEMIDGKAVLEEKPIAAKLEVVCKCTREKAKAVLELFAERTDITRPMYQQHIIAERYNITTTK